MLCFFEGYQSQPSFLLLVEYQCVMLTRITNYITIVVVTTLIQKLGVVYTILKDVMIRIDNIDHLCYVKL